MELFERYGNLDKHPAQKVGFPDPRKYHRGRETRNGNEEILIS